MDHNQKRLNSTTISSVGEMHSFKQTRAEKCSSELPTIYTFEQLLFTFKWLRIWNPTDIANNQNLEIAYLPDDDDDDDGGDDQL